MNQGEIWLVDLGTPGTVAIAGHEQGNSAYGGSKPAIILSSNAYNNAGTGMRIIVPLTTNIRGVPTEITLGPPTTPKDCVAMVDQTRAVSIERLERRLGSVPDDILDDIRGILNVIIQ